MSVQTALCLGASGFAVAASPGLPLQGKIIYPAKLYSSITGGKPVSATLLEKGKQFLLQGQYLQAEECFRQSVIEHPNDAMVHYYLANALVYLKKHSEAMSEYKTAFLLDPYGSVSGYCRKALAAYKQREIEIGESTSEPISAAERLGLRTKDDGHRGKSVQCIRDQAEREKSRHHSYADAIAATIVRAGESRAQVIEKNTHEAINETLNSPLKIRPFENPLVAIENRKLQVEQMRRESEEAAKLERAQAAERSNKYKSWSLQHDSSLDEIADNLEELLSTKSLPGSAQLRPEGTGLFVRYYGGAAPAQDVHNSVAHFSSHGFLPEEPADSEYTKRQKLDRPSESTVRGALK